MDVKVKIFLVVLLILLIKGLYSIRIDVGETDLIGKYYTKPYGVVYQGQLNKYSDSLVITKDYETIRSEYKNGKIFHEFHGSWQNWHNDGRYSIGIDIYSNDLQPRKSLLTGDIYFQSGELVFHKVDR